MATDTYVYPGESLESDQIRLIRVRPGAWKDPIVCDLYNMRHISFDDKPIPYYTLSYVWGSRGASREVILSGRPCKVTVNLERALRYYRHHYPKGADLWADALCIDQTNVTERTHQVRLMGQIYSKCKKMVIYLGDRLEYSSGDESNGQQKPRIAFHSGHVKKRCSAGLAIQLIREFSSNSHLSDIHSFQNQEDLECKLESLRRLVHAPFTPWWDRVWVVQEAALAPAIDVMQGFYVLPWLDFAHAALNFKQHSVSCCSTYLAGLQRDLIKVVEDFSKRVLAVHESRGGMQAMSLSSLLCTFRNRQASDSRDKVYALLSLTASNIVPDYSVSEMDAFCAATKECIISSQNLSILNNDLGRKWREDLPSWVPDWGSPGSPIVDRRAEIAATCYSTSPGFDGRVLHISDRNLIVVGKEITEVYKIGDMMWGETDRIIQDTLSQWWAILPRRLRKAFWTTICGDVVTSEAGTSFRRSNPSDERTFATWAHESRQSPYLPGERKPDADEGERQRKIVEGLGKSKINLFELYDSLEEAGLIRISPLGIHDIEFKDPVRVSEAFRKYKLKQNTSQYNSHREYRFNFDLKRCSFEKGLPWHMAFPVLCSPDIWTASPGFRTKVCAFERSVGIATLFRRLIIFGSSPAEQIVERQEWLRSTGRSAQLDIRLQSVEQKVGLGPSETQVGDRLFILEGARTPLILRPVDLSGKRYKIIGDCYVHGMMDDCTGLLAKGEREKIWLV